MCSNLAQAILARTISLKHHIAFACVEVLGLFYFCILRQSHFHGAQRMAVDGRPIWMDSGAPGATSEVVQWPLFLTSLKSAARGSSPGPGGCTYEHLKVPPR